MVSKVAGNYPERSRRPPGTTPEARETQLIAAAVDLAEQQIRDGTATSQVITHYLKLGSSRERLEQEQLQKNNDLLAAKVKQIGQLEDHIRITEDALRAMRTYQGAPPEELEEGYDVRL